MTRAGPDIEEMKAATGRRITAMMEARGETPTTLEKKTGISRPVITRLAKGQRPAKMQHLVVLATALGCTVSDLAPELLAAEARPPPRPAPLPTRSVSDPDRSVASLPMPASLEAYLAKHVRLHPAVRHHLQLNHDLRTEGWVERDEAFWADLAVYFAKRLRVPLEEEGGAQGTGAARKSKG
jgi:transcriptional regulator with XRE-family HTH domain